MPLQAGGSAIDRVSDLLPLTCTFRGHMNGSMGRVDAESCTKDLYEATKKIASESDAASVASKFCIERLDGSIFPTWVAVFGLFVTLIGLLVAYGPSFLHPLTPASIQKPHVRGRVIIGHGCEVVGVLLSAWGIAQL